MELDTIVCGDCLDVMGDMPDGCVDLVVTDPPYGIGADKGTNGFGVSEVSRYPDNWDANRPSKKVFDEILRVGQAVIIFGGNYFADMLCRSTHWIVWDKKGNIQFQNPFSDCELLWTNLKKKTVKKYTFIQQGFITDSKDERYHPTQKPSEFVIRLIKDYSVAEDLIFDPFMGSGTTAVAALKLRRHFYGCDISPKYVKLANERIEKTRLEMAQLSFSV